MSGVPRKMPLTLRDDNELSEEHLMKRIVEETSPCKTSIDLRYFIEFTGGRGSEQRWLKVYEDGKIHFGTRVSREIEGDRLRLLINKAGTIIVLESVEKGGNLLRRYKTTGAQLNCSNAAKHLKRVGIKLPATYRLEWDEHMEMWVGRLVKDEAKKEENSHAAGV